MASVNTNTTSPTPSHGTNQSSDTGLTGSSSMMGVDDGTDILGSMNMSFADDPYYSSAAIGGGMGRTSLQHQQHYMGSIGQQLSSANFSSMTSTAPQTMPPPLVKRNTSSGTVPTVASNPVTTAPVKSSPVTATAAPGTNQSGNSQQPYLRVARFVGPPPVALACTECRSRHLKCDAGTPACSRCITDKRECNYIKSRRGWKGSKRRANIYYEKLKEQQGTNKMPSPDAEDGRMYKSESETTQGYTSGGGGGYNSQYGGYTSGGADAGVMPMPQRYGSMSEGPRHSRALSTSSQDGNSPPISRADSSVSPTQHRVHPHMQQPHRTHLSNPLETIQNHYKRSSSFPSAQEHTAPGSNASLINLYYNYFHAGHPFILPPSFLIKTPAAKMTQLLPVMRYIGSFFANSAPSQSFRDAADYTLFQQPAPRNGYTVQAMILFSIGLHADNDSERAEQVKNIAIELSLELGMNLEEYAEQYGEGNPVLEESWRRTWWELYFLDGILAGVHQRDSFRLWNVECTTSLPCEEADYNVGRIPPPHTLQQFDDRYFAAEHIVFSSFTYRVEAVRILGQVLSLGQHAAPTPPPPASQDPETPTADELRADAADASLTTWALHLPSLKKELIDKDGKLDEMLFQAHMIHNQTAIYLHRPKSHLALSLIPTETALTPHPPTHGTVQASLKPVAYHTTKALQAADNISKLITMPTPLVRHTPFFTCVITLGAVVHLSACSWLLFGEEGFIAKERVRLSVGALKTMEDVWAVAACVLAQVKMVARAVFQLPRPDGLPMVPGENGIGGSLTEDEVMRFIDEETALEIFGQMQQEGAGAVDWSQAGAAAGIWQPQQQHGDFQS